MQLRDLLEKADTLSGTLAEKDRTLVSLLDQSQAILDLVTRRRADIASGIESTNIAIGQLAGILGGHLTELDLILETLHPTIDILDRRQADLDRTLAYLGPGALGLARATVHGPWADIYVRSIGPGLLGLLQQLMGTGPVIRRLATPLAIAMAPLGLAGCSWAWVAERVPAHRVLRQGASACTPPRA